MTERLQTSSENRGGRRSTHSCSHTDRQGPPTPPAGRLLEWKRRRPLLLLGRVAHGRVGSRDRRPLPGGQSTPCGAPGWHRPVSERRRRPGWADRCVKQSSRHCFVLLEETCLVFSGQLFLLVPHEGHAPLLLLDDAVFILDLFLDILQP